MGNIHIVQAYVVVYHTWGTPMEHFVAEVPELLVEQVEIVASWPDKAPNLPEF